MISKTLAPVMPMRIFGAYQAFPKGSRALRLTKITVVIGEPLRFTREEILPATRETYQRLGDRVMEAIAALKIDGKGFAHDENRLLRAGLVLKAKRRDSRAKAMTLLEEIEVHPLCGDGAMGTLLQERGAAARRMSRGTLHLPSRTVREIHADYLAAGARIIETNTFGANGRALGTAWTFESRQ